MTAPKERSATPGDFVLMLALYPASVVSSAVCASLVSDMFAVGGYAVAPAGVFAAFTLVSLLRESSNATPGMVPIGWVNKVIARLASQMLSCWLALAFARAWFGVSP